METEYREQLIVELNRIKEHQKVENVINKTKDYEQCRKNLWYNQSIRYILGKY